MSSPVHMAAIIQRWDEPCTGIASFHPSLSAPGAFSRALRQVPLQPMILFGASLSPCGYSCRVLAARIRCKRWQSTWMTRPVKIETSPCPMPRSSTRSWRHCGRLVSILCQNCVSIHPRCAWETPSFQNFSPPRQSSVDCLLHWVALIHPTLAWTLLRRTLHWTTSQSSVT